jgi:hypothetical protein
MNTNLFILFPPAFRVIILPVVWAVREPPLALRNVRSNFVNCPSPLVWGRYVSFNGCRASFTPPFLPIIETVGFSLPVTVPERTENYSHSFRKLLTYRRKAGDSSKLRTNYLYASLPVVIIKIMPSFFFFSAGSKTRDRAERLLSARVPVQYSSGFHCRKIHAGSPSVRSH